MKIQQLETQTVSRVNAAHYNVARLLTIIQLFQYSQGELIQVLHKTLI